MARRVGGERPSAASVQPDAPLQLARRVTAAAESAWADGGLVAKVTPVTADLIRFWFDDAHRQTRPVNFHTGQRQAILNAIYVHEVWGSASVADLYQNAAADDPLPVDPAYLQKSKFTHPKYCLKMATGTGKTWVLQALLVWQYLNARHEETLSGRFQKNFLLVAPGLIVYDRLLDALTGRLNEDGSRDFSTADLSRHQDLFLPPAYRDEVFGFLQTGVAGKEDVGRKAVGDGLIAVMNWQAFLDEEEESPGEDNLPLEDPSGAVREILPLTPGTSAGHSLETLDRRYLRGGALNYLGSLEGLVVFNDEAHHIHDMKKAGEVIEVEWQKALNRLAAGVGTRLVQIDFSATPYDVHGNGPRRTKFYFPHIIADFNLRTAIHQGLVKTLTLDKRREFATQEMEFRAMRDGNRVVGLSEGQKLMLRAGLTKLNRLEKEFVALTQDKEGRSDKHPKMLVVCEDTEVTPHVEEFMRGEGLVAEDVLRVDSDLKGSIPAKEWDKIKFKLFQVDAHARPRVIVSVLMLREGFDVNNICVIVPLRSSESAILLEQIIGRGLRLMWREPEYQEEKDENRRRLLDLKQEPTNYLDLLSIVEHPAFMKFYEDLNEMADVLTEVEDKEGTRAAGEIIRVGLKPDYKTYDLFWPVIVQEREESLAWDGSLLEPMAGFKLFDLEKLRKMAPSGERFFAEEVTVRTQFGEYKVQGGSLRASSYNELLARLVEVACRRLVRAAERSRFFPSLQVNEALLAEKLDRFVREGLFGQAFDPLEGENWRILLLSKTGVTEHLLKELSKIIYHAQTQVSVEEAVVEKEWFSQVDSLKMRENYSLIVRKTIYGRLSFPTHRGGLERDFIQACDQDTSVESFLKVNETYHSFAHLTYIRMDGLLARHFPDFMVKTSDRLWLVETKADADLANLNVRQKRQGALDWLERINALPSDKRDGREWGYVLLGETTFRSMREKSASIAEVLVYCVLSRARVEGVLFS
jgi:type III restriction enzyme